MPEKAPSISIITATYNAAEHLPGLIESIRQQTDKDFEWIVIDGASQDRTLEIIKNARDVITDYVSEPDCGIYHALNKGIKFARGDYYLVVGADDKLDCKAIQNYKSVVLLEHYPDIVTAQVRIETGRIIKPRKTPLWIHGAHSLVSVHAVGTLIKKNLHDLYGLYSYFYPVAADSEFIMRVYKEKVRIVRASFIAGDYSTKGFSSQKLLTSLLDDFRINMIFCSKTTQIILLFLRIIKNFGAIQSRV
ncbi:glycosyltransferase [Thermosynechococcus sp. FA-CM-4201]